MLELIKLRDDSNYYKLRKGPGDEVILQLVQAGSDASSIRLTTTDLIIMCQWRFTICERIPITTEIPLPELPYWLSLDVSTTLRQYQGPDAGKYRYAVLFLTEMLRILPRLSGTATARGVEYVPDVKRFGWNIIFDSLMNQKRITSDMALQVGNRHIIVSKDNRTSKSIDKKEKYDLYLKRLTGIYEAVDTYEFLTK